MTMNWVATTFQDLSRDVAYSVRVHRRRWRESILVLLTLALALGAATGVFSVVNALLLRPLPVPDADRLVEVDHFGTIEFDLHKRTAFKAWQSRATWWSDVTAFRAPEMSLIVSGRAVRVRVAETTGDYFSTLGARAHLGRFFTVDEDIPGNDSVAVLSYGMWQQLFGGDPTVLGRKIRLNGSTVTLIGVANPEFTFPGATAIWTPTYFDPTRLPKTDNFFGTAIGRLRTGVSLPTAIAQWESSVQHSFSWTTRDPATRPRLVSLRSGIVGSARQASLIMLAMVMFVVAVACSNLAQLFLSRVRERSQELAIRRVLGGSAGRIARQLITECMILTGLACALGLLVAHWIARFAMYSQPGGLSNQNDQLLDWRVLTFAFVLAILTGLLFGALPAALLAKRGRNVVSTRDQAGAGNQVGRARGVLIGVQTACTVVLIVGFLTMSASFVRLLQVDLGFNTRRVATLSISLLGSSWEVKPAQYFRECLDRLRSRSEVESVGLADNPPLLGQQALGSENVTLDSGQTVDTVSIRISPGYFRSIGADLIAGRDFGDGDHEQSAAVAIVNSQFLKSAGISAENLVGRNLRIEGRKPVMVVGIARSTRFKPTSPAFEILYLPVSQDPSKFGTFVVQVKDDPSRDLASLAATIRQLDSEVAVFGIKTLQQRLDEANGQPRFYVFIVSCLAGFALVLSIAGNYAVVSNMITQRRHEIGVRLAVGGTPNGVRALVVRQNILPVTTGLLIGIGIALQLEPLLRTVIAGTESLQWAICSGAVIVMAASSMFAIWRATARVVGIDPVSALTS